MTKHTAGPWVHHPDDNIITTHGGRLILEWVARTNHRLSGETSIEERNANARLVAAAPELLEALKTLIDMDVAYQRGDKVAQAVDAAKAAIAKAEEQA